MRGGLWQLGQSITRRLAQADKKTIARRCFASEADLKKTVLYDFHVANGGKMVPFAGWSMPIQYKDSIMESTLNCRENGSLFDVAHMCGQSLKGKDCIPFLEKLVVADVAGLSDGTGTLTVFTNEKGGAIDDSVVEVDDDLDQLGSRVGNVFMPLRACTSKNKRKIMENPVVHAESSSHSGGGFRGVKTANKEVESMGKDSKPLKILSYNVWFREDLEMHGRMEALGDLILLHSPDVICFQEVTPNIYDVFQQSSWWKLYRCSVSNEASFTRGYFCMQLCKLSVKSYSCKPFANSIMRRELCVAEVDVPTENSLIVATSHLESPCPAPPKWDQMYSKERVIQAKHAIKHLEENPNVIFCGDMNWDDKLDGQFPLPDGWVDAWVQFHPSENGWTYDTKSNKMLSGNRTLQKRLDRFVCNLRDFKINEIEMIGMDEIPGLSYCKEKKVKTEVKKLILPVLPSDHYGLVLTISPQ